MTKKSLPFIPSNLVEQLQIDAISSFDKRNEFWKALLNIDVFVLSESGVNEGEEILHTWEGEGEGACGIFTSLEKLVAVMPPETPYIQINARAIFEVMVSEALGTFINPRYEPMVRLSSKELKSMLEGKFSEITGSSA